MYNKNPLNYIIIPLALLSLAGCDTFFGTKGKPAYNPRTASLENRRDEEIFSAQYDVHFDSNGTMPDQESSATIKTVAELIKKSDPTLVVVTGYTDTFGSASYNQILSKKRAQLVAKSLRKEGVNKDLIIVEGKGENDLLFPTQDEVKLLENRRVTIQIKK